MSRISQRFEQLKARNKTALIPLLLLEILTGCDRPIDACNGGGGWLALSN